MRMVREIAQNPSILEVARRAIEILLDDLMNPDMERFSVKNAQKTLQALANHVLASTDPLAHLRGLKPQQHQKDSDNRICHQRPQLSQLATELQAAQEERDEARSNRDSQQRLAIDGLLRNKDLQQLADERGREVERLRMALTPRVVMEMRCEHDAGDGHFSTAEVEACEAAISSKPDTGCEDDYEFSNLEVQEIRKVLATPAAAPPAPADCAFRDARNDAVDCITFVSRLTGRAKDGAEMCSVCADALPPAQERPDKAYRYVCTLCKGHAEWDAPQKVWRHTGHPFHDEFLAQSFCDKYGYPIDVELDAARTAPGAQG